MTPLSRDELVELGLSIPAESLAGWAAEQVEATKGNEDRLKARGVNAAFLTALKDLLTKVEGQRKSSAVPHGPSGQAADVAFRARSNALTYWREAQQIAKAEFGAQPDLLAKFRPGVRTGLLVGPLAVELETVVAQTRAHADRLSGLGGDAEFAAKGDVLVGKLRTAKADLDAAARDLPPAEAQQCHEKGLLYDLTRRLVRAGRLAFLGDAKRSADFNFTAIRKAREGRETAAKQLERK